MKGNALAASLLLLLPLCLAAQEQVVLSGRVFEFGTRSGVVGATVTIASVGTVTTGRNGDFRFPRMTPGERIVTISALGYQTRELRLNVQRDTTIVVELEVQALRVDSLKVEARTLTVRGKILDRITQEPVFDADVALPNNRNASSNLLGNFKVTRVPAEVPATVAVRAPGYEPFNTTITAHRDTTIRIELALDPVGQRMIAAQVQRFEKRSRGVNASLSQWNYDFISSGPSVTLGEFLKHRMITRSTLCFFADDVDYTARLPDVLDSYLTDELDRIEVYDRGVMLRIYSRRYIAKQSNNKPLRTITYMTGVHLVCM